MVFWPRGTSKKAKHVILWRCSLMGVVDHKVSLVSGYENSRRFRSCVIHRRPVSRAWVHKYIFISKRGFPKMTRNAKGVFAKTKWETKDMHQAMFTLLEMICWCISTSWLSFLFQVSFLTPKVWRCNHSEGIPHITWRMQKWIGKTATFWIAAERLCK